MHNASRHERGGSLHAGWQYWIQGLVRFRARPLPSWVFTRGARTAAIDLRVSSNHACQAVPGRVQKRGYSDNALHSTCCVGKGDGLSHHAWM